MQSVRGPEDRTGRETFKAVPLFFSQWPWFLSDLFRKLYNVFCLEILIDLSRPLSRGEGIARARPSEMGFALRYTNFTGQAEIAEIIFPV